MRSVHRPLSAFLTLPVLGAFVVFSVFTGRFTAFAAFLVSLSACCMAYAVLSRYGLSLEIQAPTRATAGDTVDLSLLLHTRWPLPKFVSTSVAQVVAPAGESSGPGMTCRTEHGMIYHQSSRTPSERHEPPEAHENRGRYEMDGFLIWRGRCRIHREIAVPYRGVLKLLSIRLFFSDPLGVFAIRRTWRINHEVLIRIRPLPGAPLLDIAGTFGRIETHKRMGELGEANEYAGSRPYRPGDELRYLHWPTVARTGELYVREYTPSSADSICALLIRGTRPPRTGLTVEATLRALVAFVLELFSRRVNVTFATNIGEAFALPIGYSQRNLQRFHDHVSRMNINSPCEPPDTFLSGLTYTSPERPGVVAFCLGAMGSDTLTAIAADLRVNPNQIKLVVCSSKEEPCDWISASYGSDIVEFEADKPEMLFAGLHLN